MATSLPDLGMLCNVLSMFWHVLGMHGNVLGMLCNVLSMLWHVLGMLGNVLGRPWLL